MRALDRSPKKRAGDDVTKTRAVSHVETCKSGKLWESQGPGRRNAIGDSNRPGR